MTAAPLRRRLPAARRPGERGILHGLSLIAFTILLFGALAYFALGSFPLRCACKDGTLQRGTQSGFDSARKRCEQVCATRGGGVPAAKDAQPPAETATKVGGKKKDAR